MKKPLLLFLALVASTVFAAGDIDFLSPACTITSSICHNKYPARNAFNNDISTDAGRWLANVQQETPAYVEMTFTDGSTYRPTSYTIISSPNKSYGKKRAPKAFSLQGSMDGIAWTVLDSQTDQTGWGTKEVRTFSVSSPAANPKKEHPKN